jgi:hypothetical protein
MTLSRIPFLSSPSGANRKSSNSGPSRGAERERDIPHRAPEYRTLTCEACRVWILPRPCRRIFHLQDRYRAHVGFSSLLSLDRARMHLFGASGDQFHWLPPPWGHLTHALLGSRNLFKIAHCSGQSTALSPSRPDGKPGGKSCATKSGAAEFTRLRRSRGCSGLKVICRSPAIRAYKGPVGFCANFLTVRSAPA